MCTVFGKLSWLSWICNLSDVQCCGGISRCAYSRVSFGRGPGEARAGAWREWRNHAVIYSWGSRLLAEPALGLGDLMSNHVWGVDNIMISSVTISGYPDIHAPLIWLKSQYTLCKEVDVLVNSCPVSSICSHQSRCLIQLTGSRETALPNLLRKLGESPANRLWNVRTEAGFGKWLIHKAIASQIG